MAKIKQTKNMEQLKSMPIGDVRKEYIALANAYNKIVNFEEIYCPICSEFKPRKNFYISSKTKSGVNHCGCKSCMTELATDVVDRKKHIYTDNREKTIKVFEMLDLPFYEETYNSQLNLVNEEGMQRRGTAFSQLISMTSSLPQWNDKTFKDSKFCSEEYGADDNVKIVQKTLKNAKKRFGSGYSDDEYMFLENEYQDWTTRYPCEQKSQELLFQRVCCTELRIDKAEKCGKETKELDKTLQDQLSSLGIKPSQSNSNALSDTQTFGQLIAKWEEEKPIPEPDDDFKDVDKIGMYIEVFFKGHLAKMMGLKNAFSVAYEKFMKKYTVTKPEYNEDDDSEDIFNKIFGSDMDGGDE